jgi:hypothetical protein
MSGFSVYEQFIVNVPASPDAAFRVSQEALDVAVQGLFAVTETLMEVPALLSKEAVVLETSSKVSLVQLNVMAMDAIMAIAANALHERAR